MIVVPQPLKACSLTSLCCSFQVHIPFKRGWNQGMLSKMYPGWFVIERIHFLKSYFRQILLRHIYREIYIWSSIPWNCISDIAGKLSVWSLEILCGSVFFPNCAWLNAKWSQRQLWKEWLQNLTGKVRQWSQIRAAGSQLQRSSDNNG